MRKLAYYINVQKTYKKGSNKFQLLTWTMHITDTQLVFFIQNRIAISNGRAIDPDSNCVFILLQPVCKFTVCIKRINRERQTPVISGLDQNSDRIIHWIMCRYSRKDVLLGNSVILHQNLHNTLLKLQVEKARADRRQIKGLSGDYISHQPNQITSFDEAAESSFSLYYVFFAWFTAALVCWVALTNVKA